MQDTMNKQQRNFNVMLRCPQCASSPVQILPVEWDAINNGLPFWCSSCGAEYSIHSQRLTLDAEQRVGADGGGGATCPACGEKMITPKPLCLNCISKAPRPPLPEGADKPMSEAEHEMYHDFQRETACNYCSECGAALRPDKPDGD